MMAALALGITAGLALFGVVIFLAGVNLMSRKGFGWKLLGTLIAMLGFLLCAPVVGAVISVL